MSARRPSGSPPAAGDNHDRQPASRSDTPTLWHPAREWLEEDEDDDHDVDFEPESEFSEDREIDDLYDEGDEDPDFHAAGFGRFD